MAEKKAKISVLTPTYNDSESIEETLISLIKQTYQNWEWIVINDGSTDDTETHIIGLIEKYGISEKCRYVYQQNADQLNALLHGLGFINGDYVFTLHSDDLLPEENFFQKCIEEMEKHPDIDGIFGDLLLIDEHSEVVGRQNVDEYRVWDGTPALMLLWLGRNLYSDVAFHRASVYSDSVKDNYLTWNMPLWIDLRNEGIKMLNYMSVSFPVLKYRVHAGNYINNELGRMNVINGELRTAVELMKHYSIPAYRHQYLMYRTMNKLFPNRKFRVKYAKKATVDPYKIISFIIQKRYPEGVKDNPFLSSLLGFYGKKSKREVCLPQLKDVKVYYGKDVRLFNRHVLQNDLEPFYLSFMQEMKKGFSRVIVQDEEDAEKIKVIMKFLCIGYAEVGIKG